MASPLAIRGVPRPRKNALAFFLSLALVVISGKTPASGESQALRLQENLEAAIFPLPSANSPVEGFAVCKPALILIPIQNGVFAAGWDSWLIAPGEFAVASVDCDEEKTLFLLLADSSMVKISGGVSTGKREMIGKLPPGKYQLLSAPNSTLWIWGKTSAGEYALFLCRRHENIEEVWKGSGPIQTAAAAGSSGLLAAIGKKLVLLERGKPVEVLADLDNRIDGLAADTAGRIYLSSEKGVIQITAKNQANIVAAGAHGPLRIRGEKLYILWREKSAVVQIGERRAGSAP